MSGSPVTAGPEIGSIPRRREALVVLDIDEVVLHFIEPFSNLLEERGQRLHPESFRLTGNIRSISTGAAVSGGDVEAATLALYGEQERRQHLVEGAAAAIQRLSEEADILFLTAMTPSFYPQRRRLLDREGLSFPMIATESPKGPVIAELAAAGDGGCVFVDDLPPNLHSVRRNAPDVGLVHLMANEVFRPHLPPLPLGAEAARDWPHALEIITRMLEQPASKL